jgi:hypothetical protein
MVRGGGRVHVVLGRTDAEGRGGHRQAWRPCATDCLPMAVCSLSARPFSPLSGAAWPTCGPWVLLCVTERGWLCQLRPRRVPPERAVAHGRHLHYDARLDWPRLRPAPARGHQPPSLALTCVCVCVCLWVALGEDGPTHQPVEALQTLRATPNVLLLRPADGNEVSGAYALAIEGRHRPTVLSLSRQNVDNLEGTDMDKVKLGTCRRVEWGTHDRWQGS